MNIKLKKRNKRFEDALHLRKKKEKNREQRREFVKFWANYVKTHPDKEWPRQQNLLINSQLTPEI